MSKEEGQRPNNDGTGEEEQSPADEAGLYCDVTNPNLFYSESQFYGEEIDSNICTSFSTMPFLDDEEEAENGATPCVTKWKDVTQSSKEKCTKFSIDSAKETGWKHAKEEVKHI